MTDTLLDRRALREWLGFKSERSVSRLAQLIPPDLYLSGRPRWKRERVERELAKLSRGRRRRVLPARDDAGCFVSGNDATRGGNSAGREILGNTDAVNYFTIEPADSNG